MDEDNILNVLLLGAIGAGKSSLIDTLKGKIYLPNFDYANEFGTFDNIPRTQNVEEHIVLIGGKTVRLIDTPGIGHVGGPEKDSKIIKNIFTNISQKYKKIHGICILFNIQHQWQLYCITTFLRRLHKNAAKNIVFICTECQKGLFWADQLFNTFDLIFDKVKRQISILMNRAKDIYFLHDDYDSQYYCHNVKELPINLFGKQLADHFTKIIPHDMEETLALNEAQKFYLFLYGQTVDICQSIVQTFANVLTTHAIYLFHDLDEVINDYLMDITAKTEDELLKKEYQNQRIDTFKSLYFAIPTEHIPSNANELNEIVALIKNLNDRSPGVDENGIFNIKLIEKILTLKPYSSSNRSADPIKIMSMEEIVKAIVKMASSKLEEERIAYLKKAGKSNAATRNLPGYKMPKDGCCQYCGKGASLLTSHNFEKCYAKKKFCKFCEKKGHIEAVCQLREILFDKVLKEIYSPKSNSDETQNESNQSNSIVEDTTVANITTKTKNLEISKSQNAKTQNVTTSKPKTSSNPKSKLSSKCCYFCGSEKYHPYATCFAKQEVCKICNKKGHIEEACRQKKRSEKEVAPKKPRTFVNKKVKK